MNKKYKMLVADYDGTLINDNLEITENNLKAINGFIERGGVFVVNTGRTALNIINCLKGYNFKGVFSCLNGAKIMDIETAKILYSLEIDNKTAVEFCKVVEDFGSYLQTYPKDDIFVSSDNKIANMYAKKMKCKLTPKTPLYKFLEESKINTSKFLVFDRKERLTELLKILEVFNDRLEIVRADDIMLEITVKNTTKGNSVIKFSEMFNIPLEDIICVGDSGNDIAMLKVAGLPIAMENGVEEVKKIAKVIAPNNNQDAMKFIIDNYCI